MLHRSSSGAVPWPDCAQDGCVNRSSIAGLSLEVKFVGRAGSTVVPLSCDMVRHSLPVCVRKSVNSVPLPSSTVVGSFAPSHRASPATIGWPAGACVRLSCHRDASSVYAIVILACWLEPSGLEKLSHSNENSVLPLGRRTIGPILPLSTPRAEPNPRPKKAGCSDDTFQASSRRVGSHRAFIAMSAYG